MGDGVEATELPVPSLHKHAQRSGEIGIIFRDGKELRPLGEEGIHPHGSGGERPTTMVGYNHAEAWRTGPQTPYDTTPRGVPLG